ncbi:hypothetical protein [Achromobacter animicus]|uniref:hypothetical protein n=1 Tax=Achromobacter animicus TaxID=1389935 RepID=UPI00345E5B07
MSSAVFLEITKIFVGCWAILSGMEWLANRRLFLRTGLLAWHVLRLRSGITMRLGPALSSAFGAAPSFAAVQILRIACGVGVLFSSNYLLLSMLLTVLFCCCAWTNYRACFGGDGSDQMGLVVTSGTLIVSLGMVGNDDYLAYAGIILIGGQAVLAYFFAGASKIISPVWRGGEAVKGVMNTANFGNPWAARLLMRHPKISLVVGWLVIITEMMFPLVLVMPDSLLAMSLMGFFLFHLSNAYFMGLNSFVLSFVATYPAIVKINYALREIF